MRASTIRSRSVSWGKRSGAGLLRAPLKYVIMRSAMPGPKMTSPAPTASMERTISVAGRP